MKNRIKEILYGFLVIFVILVLGFTPVAQKELFSLDWKNFGLQMVEAGVIDQTKFENLYTQRGGLSEADKKLLYGADNKNLVINSENSGVVLNMLWAFGLANKNPILENGSIMDPKYGGAGNFASTGGWTLAKGNAMDHYSMHSFVTLTPEQQALVERVSKGIFRPCCNNSTYFPDCNHGMAMLGLLELMASQGATEADMYKITLEVNTLWFPDTYEAIKTFVTSQGIDWNTIDPKKILGADYSSVSGYQKILSQIKPQEQKGGASCGA
ncbi:hypothetical protein A3D42_00970 [Candidatus Nomurabacteria bacterium RIFCSPHIGHO2_02_FULL_41_18]|uniref:Uncharacterized protein n=1 Tax=Candidatus Nomurabacteria bacterium RIFCSPHIGHO2_02_FULL_41_18 TaxID=1801754 RepID=A0A1F6W6L8_9BACT|nr:MAG: hypothetical protein A2737_03175 [Candidatus Nomurabacteria bacterium RIFCSPHIGHO2_01_FULL_41_71]OGI77553.1 MAG: hypothetical protein A3D42_00970 [Candidatus Nomurabacteria bacterium RIFCSPHIGHO2_02_FULL_41_18]OGI89053.1 MAG: hypothetical protein A3B01_00550 [Candidatus Nomurabacteria bacterium RIFCSPLOWO2_01_FULL_41_52b]OGJ00266.1 MAG: hypothetical protein A3I90_01595 [Candidatus Nomurabacteria bacterium RIFCSPLOWO2_02_FULL_41_9]